MLTNQIINSIFLFHELPACNKTADFLRLTTNLIAHLRSQFIYAFALLIPMSRFKSINFCQNRPKIKLFFTKKFQILRALGAKPPDPTPPALGACPPNSKWLKLPLLN